MITPFNLFIKNNFPFIENTYEALDNYGLLCKIVEKLNEVINSQNGVDSSIEELKQNFIDLQNYVDNYFDNLDVQNEINNKLDEMATDGTLDEIINTNIFNTLNTKVTSLENQVKKFDRIYNNVTDMINDASNISTSTYVKTLGYNSVGDGGRWNLLYCKV